MYDHEDSPPNRAREVLTACGSAVSKGLGEHVAWCVFAELNAVDFGD